MRGRPFRRLLVQVESLHRVDRSLADEYDVLVLDEVMSTLGQLFSPTMRHLRRVDPLLARLLARCPRVIAMDATANAQLVGLLADLRGDDDVHVVVGEYAAPGFSERVCTFARELGVDSLAHVAAPPSPAAGGERPEEAPRPPSRPRPGTFFHELGRRLQGGLNVCVFSSTVAFSEAAARFCAAFTESVLVLNSLRGGRADVSSWGRYRAVVYTTVVTVGLSFDEPHFHSMFAYVKPDARGPDMVSVYQSLGRVRALRLNELLVYVDGSAARAESVFAPMLLNHAVAAARGGWPAVFAQVTAMLCCKFRRACDAAFADAPEETALFARLKHKHLFERCTLSSLGDSLNVLHALLESNRVLVRFAAPAGAGEEPAPAGRLGADGFCRLLRDLRDDARISQRELRALRRAEALDVPAAADVADSAETAEFAERFLRDAATLEETTELLRKLADVARREHFVNLALLQACRRTPGALDSPAAFERLRERYAGGELPVIGAGGELETVALARDVDPRPRWELFALTARLADALGWDPGDGRGDVEVAAETLLALVGPRADEIARLLLEVTRCFVLDHATAALRPLREVRAALSGAPAGGGAPLLREAHAAALLKVLLELLFGARVARSARTFPGVPRVKNMRKSEIEELLAAAGAPEAAGPPRARRELYAALMARRGDFRRVERYRVKSPRWHALLRSAVGPPRPPDLAALEGCVEERPPASPLRLGAAEADAAEAEAATLAFAADAPDFDG